VSAAGALLTAARVPRRAVALTKDGLFAAGISGVLFAGPDEGGAWRTTLAIGPGGGSSKGGGVGVIVIEGALEHRAQLGMCDAFVDGYDAIESRYDAAIQAYRDGEIRQIVTVINSPGGARNGLFSTARRVRAKIEAAGVPTVAVADECCCSAAWTWALVSDKFYAPSDAQVASIGAVTIAESIAGKLEKEGREIRVYRSGERKMRPSGVEPFNEADDAALQARADEGGALICEWTAERRGGSKDDYLALQGAVFSGQEAMRRGLIDGLLSASEVIDMALTDAARAEMAEAVGLTASASEAEIKQRMSEGRAAIEALATEKAAHAKAAADLLALQNKGEQEKAQTAAQRARETFASDVLALRTAGRVSPVAASALLGVAADLAKGVEAVKGHYDTHGEASARHTLALVTMPAPIVPAGARAGAVPVPQPASAQLTEAQKAHCKAIGANETEYAAAMLGGKASES
jgi:ClpP class serine protease